MKKNDAKAPEKAPKHLKTATKRWWDSVISSYELQPHHVRLLTLAAEAWDRCQEARRAIEAHGLTFVDRFGVPHPRPEVGIERDARIAFARLLRELGLDLAEPDEETTRPPRVGGPR